MIIQNPRQYKIPDWFLNRKKDIKDGKFSQVLANDLNNKLRGACYQLDAWFRNCILMFRCNSVEDLERMKKIRLHRGIRHYWGVRVRGQHTKTTGRHGRTVGVAKKKGG